MPRRSDERGSCSYVSQASGGIYVNDACCETARTWPFVFIRAKCHQPPIWDRCRFVPTKCKYGRMNHEQEESTNKLIGIGIVVVAVGVVVIVSLPAVLDLMNTGATSQGQAIRVFVDLALRIVREAALPLGTALLAAGITIRVVCKK